MPSPISIHEFVGACAGITFAAALNFFQRKPMSTGVFVKHTSCAVAGFFAGRALEQLEANRRRARILAIEDYINLHPEDFPEEETKTYGDVLMRWYPVR